MSKITTAIRGVAWAAVLLIALVASGSQAAASIDASQSGSIASGRPHVCAFGATWESGKCAFPF
jgi:hypothetical protein